MTTQDLKQIDELLQKRLKSFATKDDLKQELDALRHDIKLDIDDALADIIASADHAKADRKDVENLDKRITRIEKRLALQ